MSGRRPGLPGSKIDSGDCDIGALAQLVEHLTFNQVVTGSNPVRPTISRRLHPAAPASAGFQSTGGASRRVRMNTKRL